jgi:hypothetical protein
MPEPADQPARPGRSLVGFYIAVGVVAALFVLSVSLYKPLRLRYAIHKLDRSPAAGGSGTPLMDETWQREFDLCVKAARGGNEPAMAAVFRQAQRLPFITCDTEMEAALAALAESQPQLFYRRLTRWPQGFILSVLKAIEHRCYQADQGARGNEVQFKLPAPKPGLSADEEFRRGVQLVVEDLEEYDRSPSDEARGLAKPALDFARRRFPKELAEPERAGPEPPK